MLQIPVLTRRIICQSSLKFSSVNSQQSSSEEDYKKLRKSSVTSVNVFTNERSVVQLANKNEVPKRFRKEYNLPDEAIAGLRNVLVSCNRPPKQLQNEADQLSEKLKQRRFPASPEKVKGVRDEIKKKLKDGKKKKDEDYSINDDDLALGGKIKEAQEYEIRNQVDKILKKSSYNWRPLSIETKEAASSYALSRLAPNYAEVARVLEEFSDFVPNSVLDYGSGSAAGFWALTSKWPKKDGIEQIKEITMVDTSDAMTRFGMDSIRKAGDEQSKPFVHDNVVFRRHLMPSLSTTYDLVIAHRILCEIGSVQTRLQLVESLWQRTNRFLVLIESSLTDSFEGILEARDYLLSSGVQIDQEKLQNLLEHKQLMRPEIKHLIGNNQLSDYEKFFLLREIIPEDVEIPTSLPTASVVAPCPHDLGCPMSYKGSCNFSARYRVVRADGKRSSGEKDGTEVTSFSFVILEKANRKPNRYSERILKNRQLGGHVTCDVCTAFRGIQRMTLSKGKHEGMYSKLRPRRSGDIFPLKQKTIASQDLFDFSKFI